MFVFFINQLRKTIPALLLLFFFATGVQAAEQNYDELFVYIGDSLMKAKTGDQQAISENIILFESEWDAVKTNSEQSKKVDECLLDVKNAIKKKRNIEQIKQQLSALSESLVKFDEAQNPVNKEADHEQLRKLIPLIDDMKVTVEGGNTKKAESDYLLLLKRWTEIEKIVRNESVAYYGEMETYMGLTRIAISKDPIDQQSAKDNLNSLKSSIKDFLVGKTKEGNSHDYSLSDITRLLERSEESINEGKLNEAVDSLYEIITIWPMVEGDVSTRDRKLYSDMETNIPTAISIVDSKKINKKEALTIVADLHKRLLPLTHETSYSIWDSSLVLLREGLEALLIVATLLSFLKRVGQSDKQKWIWGGVIAGLAASAGLSVIINLLFSQVTAATSREYLEGIVGIVAVLMMLTVGAWLHSKSNIHSWNHYIDSQMNQAIATGRLFSFALISFFAIFREGAETIIFYSGMAPYMSMKQLMIGILIAVILLLIIGVVIIRYSNKLPVSLFFKTATIFIYALSFKILGVSVHALQISQVLPTHSTNAIPYVEWIGLYPTWETTLLQVLFGIVILFTTIFIKKKNTMLSKLVNNKSTIQK